MSFGWRVVGTAFVVAVFASGTGFYGPSASLHAPHEGRGWPVSTISAATTFHSLLGAAVGARLPAVPAAVTPSSTRASACPQASQLAVRRGAVPRWRGAEGRTGQERVEPERESRPLLNQKLK